MRKLLLRFRIGQEGAPRFASWVHVYVDGRLERREPGEDGLPGQLMYESFIEDVEIREVRSFARRVLSAEGLRPPSAQVHSEAHELVLELNDVRAPRSAHFRWGRTELAVFVEEHGLSRKQEWYFKRLTELLFELDYRCFERVYVDVDDRVREMEPVPVPGPATPPGPGPTPGGSVEEILRRWVANPPKRLSELEEIIGSVDFCSAPNDGFGTITRPQLAGSEPGATFSPCVRRLWVKYSWNFPHERAYALDDGRPERNPALVEVSLTFKRPSLFNFLRKGLRGVLEEALGAAVAFEDSPHGPGHRYGNFYVFNQLGESLRWYARMPDWARPKPNQEVRVRWLKELSELLRAGARSAEVSAFVESLPEELGFRRTDRDRVALFNFLCEPKMEAIAFSEAIGLGEAVAQSIGTHAQAWKLFVSGRPGGWRFVVPRLGPWRFEAYVHSRPMPVSEDASLQDRVGNPPVYDLRHCEPSEIRSFVISPEDGTWDR